MRALRVHEPIGPDGLRLDEVDVPPPPDEAAVRVEVHAAGVGFVDTLLVRGRYQVRPPTPFIPGLEVAGAVESAPPGSGFAHGDSVFGHVMGGGFAESAWVPADRLALLPAELSAVEGAASLVNHHTAIVALVRRGRLQRRDRVLVHGAGGGLGSAVVQVAAAFGNEVLAVAGSPERRELAARAGASTVYDHETWFDAVRGAGGADVIVDPVGGTVFEQSVRCLRPEGRLVTVGFTSGTIPVRRGQPAPAAQRGRRRGGLARAARRRPRAVRRDRGAVRRPGRRTVCGRWWVPPSTWPTGPPRCA